MEYSDFLEFLKKNKIRYEKACKPTGRNGCYRPEFAPDVEHFQVKWSTGGIEGGSCWDEGNEDHHRAYTSDNPPEEIVELDRILELLCPNITYIQYKNLTNGVIESGSYTEYEYYGNSTNYSYKQIKLPVLFEKLKEKGLIE